MGWISKRFNDNRAKWGKPVSPEKRKAPLREIVAVLRPRASLFDSDRVRLSCGHEVEAFGDKRARCVHCARGAGDFPVSQPQ